MREPESREEMVIHDLTLQMDEAKDALCAIRAGEVDALVVTTPDNTPRVFLLKGADEAHRILLETLNEGAMMIAPDATILYANRRLADLVGHPLSRVLGAPLTRFIAADSLVAFQVLLAEGSGGGKGEVVLVTARDERVPVMLSLRAVGHETETFTVVVTDLSPLKAAQQALRRANDELEARVVARTAEIVRVNAALRSEIAERTRLTEELQQKAEELVLADQRKDEFLSMLAHELRNPLAPIVMATEMLRHVGRGQPTVERYRTVIERQAKNLTRLVDDLLDVSRITRRSITLRLQVCELAPLVQSAVEAARPLVDAAGHSLVVQLPPWPVRLTVDPTRFEQVLVNLLNNAAKYTEPRGDISLTASVADGELVIRVRDSGVGIPPDLLPHVFDLFVQGKRSLARSQGGIGIGLTLVKNLVEMHGGTVEAHSDGAGQGTEMIVRVPLVASQGDRRTSGQDPAHGDGSASGEASAAGASRGAAIEVATGKRILVVEDNVDAAESLVDLLELWGHEVRSVRNGEDAVRVAEELRPHVALVDVGLPGIDGYEVARRLRRSAPPGAELLVIGATGYGQDSDRQQGADAGFDHHLVKPLDADLLCRLLGDAGLVSPQQRS